MAIIASLPNPNLFSSLPSIPPPNDPTSSSSTSPLSPPIPIPKYLPPKSNQKPQKKLSHSSKSPPNPALKATHRRTKYYKPVRDGVISSEGDRSVVIGESGVSYLLPGAPFEFQYSYSETPKVKPIAIREPAFLPFAPPSMPRPWTGKAPLKTAREKKMKRKIPLFDTSNPPQPGTNGLKQLEMPGSFPFGKYPQERKTREEILGEPLKKWEIRMLLKPLVSDNRQVNLGRDGLTHNMLELIHSHWRRQQVCKVRCKGVPTVDMKNVCRHLEEKTGGKIIHRVGGVVYLFRGRNYKYHSRPQYPVMLWKPAAPVYPKLIQEAPEGLTKAEADDLRLKGKTLLPICKLAKNGVYTNLVRDVRHAFEGSPLVKIDCKGMHASDYKKLGAKLKELVPCVLLSFDDEQILMWRGTNWKSMYLGASLASNYYTDNFVDGLDCSADADDNSSKSGTIVARMSPKMMSLWKNAIETNKALLLDEIPLGPEALLEKVEEFENISQATEHSYPARILSNAEGMSSLADYEDVTEIESEGSCDEYDRDEDGYGDDYDDDVLNYESDSQAPIGSLTIDQIANKLKQE